MGDPKNTIPQQTYFDDEGVHTELGTAVINSSKISPVNLEMSFAAEEESKEKLDCPGSLWARNKGLYEPPKNHKAKVPILHNTSRKQYSVADAWAKGNIAKYHRKLSGRRSADFKFLFPCLECSTCCFPYKESFIPIGEKSYTNVCANTDVWLYGDFISAFASLVCHNNHSSAPTVPINAGKDVPQLSHVTFPNSVMTIKDYKALPSGVKCIVSVMHTRLHYVVMEITIDTKTIKIFDGLHWDLLDWKDHVIRAMRNCMLIDPCVVLSSAQFYPDPAVSEIVGRSRKPQEYVTDMTS